MEGMVGMSRERRDFGERFGQGAKAAWLWALLGRRVLWYTKKKRRSGALRAVKKSEQFREGI